MTKEKALLPANEQRARLVSGIDFTRPVDEVKAQLTEKINDIDTVTHVIYTGKLSSKDMNWSSTIRLFYYRALVVPSLTETV